MCELLFKKVFRKKVKGFAFTLEVIMSLALLAFILNVSTYSMYALNAQRYMDTILTSTAIQAAKWGGTNNSVTQINGVPDIIQEANRNLESYAPDFNAKMSGTPKAVSANNNKVTITLDFDYPEMVVPFFNLGHVQTSITMDSIVKGGNLVTGD